MIRAFGSALKSICVCFGSSDSSGVSADEEYVTASSCTESSQSRKSSRRLRQALLPQNRSEEELPHRSGRGNEDNAEIRSICREELAFKFERACGNPNGPEARELREAEIWVVKAHEPVALRPTTTATSPRVQKQKTVAGRQKHGGVTGSSLDAASVGNRLMRDSEAMSRASEMAENAFSAVSPNTAQSVMLKTHSSYQDRCRSGKGAGGVQGQHVRERMITSCIEE